MEGNKDTYTKVRYATPDGRYLTEEEYAAFVEQCSNPTVRQGHTTTSSPTFPNAANLVEAIDALQRHNDTQSQRAVMTEAKPPESNLPYHGSHSVKSAVEELLNLQLEDMQNEVGGSNELLVNIVNALNATQERCAVLEENQKVLEENQRSLQSQLQAAYTLNEQLLSLWDLSRHDIENTQLVTNPQQKVSLLHSTPALYTIITRFNSMADTVNALVDKVEEVEMTQQKVLSSNNSYVTSAPIQSIAAIGSTTSTHPTTPVLTPQHVNTLNSQPQTRQLPTATSQPTTPHSNSSTVTSTASSSNITGLVPTKRPLVGLEISDGGDVEGVRIVSVKVGGPGHKAGLQEGDYIVNFNGWNVNTRDEFRAVITKAAVGVPLNITYIKAGTGTPMRTTITLLEAGADNSGSISRSATPTPSEPSARIVTRNPSLPMSPHQMRAPVGDMTVIAGGPGGPGQLMMSPKQMVNPHMINPALAMAQGRILY